MWIWVVDKRDQILRDRQYPSAAALEFLTQQHKFSNFCLPESYLVRAPFRLDLHTSIPDISFWISQAFKKKKKERKTFSQRNMRIQGLHGARSHDDTSHPSKRNWSFFVVHSVHAVCATTSRATAWSTRTEASLQQVLHLKTYFRNCWFDECYWPRSAGRITKGKKPVMIVVGFTLPT